MHTDEYEISLAKERAVCAGYVRKYRGRLDRLEQQFGMTTEAFLTAGPRPVPERELRVWQDAHEHFEHWSRKHAEYDRLLGIMKL